MLLEEGFEMVSADASDKMLKEAYKIRWDRRKEAIFDRWGKRKFLSAGMVNPLFDFLSLEIEEANWLTLDEDILPPAGDSGGPGFDALICMGNSFAHLPDFYGDQRDHLRAITNFYGLIKPGGILIIDHRNYDGILDQGQAPKNNIYYNVKC